MFSLNLRVRGNDRNYVYVTGKTKYKKAEIWRDLTLRDISVI